MRQLPNWACLGKSYLHRCRRELKNVQSYRASLDLAATSVAADARVLVTGALVHLSLALALILAPGAVWLHVT